MARKKSSLTGPRIIPQEYEMVSVDALKPHERNVNQGDLGAIVQSIDANGFYGAVVAQQSTGKILAGNFRWRAAISQGLKFIPVLWLDVDDAAALRILLADNRTNRLGSDDPAKLTELLQSILSDVGNLAGTGYTNEDLDELLSDLGSGELAVDGESGEQSEPGGHAVECPACGHQFTP